MADLKSRMTDVPGIESLTMSMSSGEMVYSIAGRTFSFGASASDATIESTIRAGIAMLPAVTTTDATPAPVVATPPEDNQAPVAAVAAAVTPTAAPAPPVASVSPSTAKAPVDAAHTVKGMLAEHTTLMAELHSAQVALLNIELQKQRSMVAGAITNVTSKIRTQTDDFAAVMGQFTNMLDDL